MGGGKPEGERVAAADARAGQGEICAEAPRQARQEKGRADIGEKADARLRHGEIERLAGNAMRRMNGEAGAAAHDDALGQRDDGLRDSA